MLFHNHIKIKLVFAFDYFCLIKEYLFILNQEQIYMYIGVKIYYIVDYNHAFYVLKIVTL